MLKGTRLDEVASLEIGGMHFTPGTLTRANQQDELKLQTNDPADARLAGGLSISVHVKLKDGRSLDLPTTVDASRPKLSLFAKNVQNEASVPNVVHLGNPDELPQDARLQFSLKTMAPETFPPNERVEVATTDESFHVLLSEQDGNLTLQDAKTILAVLDPMKLLGPSAFGPLKFRAVSGDGIDGDWQPLVNLVRVPELKAMHCAATSDSDKQCTLVGEKLFLIDAVSADPEFSNSVSVPDGYIDPTLTVPPIKGNTLYLRLRDDPSIVDVAVFPGLTTAHQNADSAR